MTDHPTLFSAPMVRALLDGRKTQTRRILTFQNTLLNGYAWHKLAKAQDWDWEKAWVDAGPSPAGNPGPYLKLPWLDGDFETYLGTVHRVYPKVQPGDRIWVKETHAIVPSSAYRMSTGVEQIVNPADRDDAAVYRADWERSAPAWKPSIFMPRWASRLTLPVKAVKIERLKDISDEDAFSEGIPLDNPRASIEVDVDGQWWPGAAVARYRTLWNSINGPNSWDKNPWVIATTFDPIRKNIDEVAK